jgi:hypothetical protein
MKDDLPPDEGPAAETTLTHAALIDMRNHGQFLQVPEVLNCSLAISRRPSGGTARCHRWQIAAGGLPVAALNWHAVASNRLATAPHED